MAQKGKRACKGGSVISIAFKAVPQLIQGRLIVRLPKQASDALPSRGMVMAQGTIDGAAFIAPLEPDGQGGHWLEIDVQKHKSNLSVPAKALAITLAPAEVWPQPKLPPDIATALREAGLQPQWDSLTVKARWEWLRWIRATANPATRAKRIAVACDKLKKGSRRPCCFNTASCTVPEVAKAGVLMEE